MNDCLSQNSHWKILLAFGQGLKMKTQTLFVQMKEQPLTKTLFELSSKESTTRNASANTGGLTAVNSLVPTRACQDIFQALLGCCLA